VDVTEPQLLVERTAPEVVEMIVAVESGIAVLAVETRSDECTLEFGLSAAGVKALMGEKNGADDLPFVTASGFGEEVVRMG
jgi:hypothetical protein